MIKWQPIETAPKDGTALLLYSPEKIKSSDSGVAVAQYKNDRSGGYWEVGYLVDEGNIPLVLNCPPTHWMPLPEKPRA